MVKVAGDVRSDSKHLVWGQRTVPKSGDPGSRGGCADTGMCDGNAELENQYKIKELAGEEASQVCVRITVVLPTSPHVG